MNEGYKVDNRIIFLVAFLLVSFIPLYVYLFLKPDPKILEEQKNKAAQEEESKSDEVKGAFDISDYPQIISSPLANVKVGEKYDYYLKGIDTDTPSEQLVYKLKESPSWLYITGDHIYGFPEKTDTGTYKVIVNVSDGFNSTDKMFYIVVYE